MISNFINNVRRRKQFKETDLIKMHHDLMCFYGWIPIEEFKKIPMNTLFTLNEKVQKEKEKLIRYKCAMICGSNLKKSDKTKLIKLMCE